jgi:drug/metabolite transporter (DMT)-like permease
MIETQHPRPTFLPLGVILAVVGVLLAVRAGQPGLIGLILGPMYLAVGRRLGTRRAWAGMVGRLVTALSLVLTLSVLLQSPGLALILDVAVPAVILYALLHTSVQARPEIGVGFRRQE